MIEEWKDISNYEGLYKISDLGRVKSLYRKDKSGVVRAEKIKSTFYDGQGYEIISLSKNGIKKTFRIHRLVAMAFIPNPDNKPEVNHIDENKAKNCAYNLEWVSKSENMRHNGLCGRIANKNRINSKSKKPILAITLDGSVLKFESINEAARRLNLHAPNLISCLKGKTKQSGGYRFEYDKEKV